MLTTVPPWATGLNFTKAFQLDGINDESVVDFYSISGKDIMFIVKTNANKVYYAISSEYNSKALDLAIEKSGINHIRSVRSGYDIMVLDEG